jgi:TRAP-type C4-dicarboxylate transport system permease small subunit
MEDQRGEGGSAPAFVRWMARIEVGIASVLMLAALVVTIATIVERNVGGSTGEWSLKLPELGLMWLTFLGMGALVTEHGHVSADMLLRRMPPRGQQVAETISALVTAAVFALILWGAISIVKQQLDIGATDDDLWDIPEGALLSVLPIGLAITILHLAAEVWTIWRPGPRQRQQDLGHSGT